jgi:hypothetical protein
MASMQPKFVTLGSQQHAHFSEQQANNTRSYGNGRGRGQGRRGNNRGRGQYAHQAAYSSDREVNPNSNGGGHEYGDLSGSYGGLYGMQTVPNGGYHNVRQVQFGGNIHAASFGGTQAAPNGGVRFASKGGAAPMPNDGSEPYTYGTDPQSRYSPFAWQVIDQNTLSVVHGGATGTRLSSHGSNAPTLQFTPVLHGQTPRRHGTDHNVKVSNQGPDKPTSVAPISTQTLSAMSASNERVHGGNRSASVGARTSIATDKMTSKQPKSLKEVDDLDRLAALGRSNLTSRLVSLRTEYLGATAAIKVKRDGIVSALGAMIEKEQDLDNTARLRHEQAANAMKVAARQPPGEKKNAALVEVATYMDSAARASNQAGEYFARIGRQKDLLEELENDRFNALDEWYDGMNRIMMKALVSVDKRQVQEKEIHTSKEVHPVKAKAGKESGVSLVANVEPGKLIGAGIPLEEQHELGLIVRENWKNMKVEHKAPSHDVTTTATAGDSQISRNSSMTSVHNELSEAKTKGKGKNGTAATNGAGDMADSRTTSVREMNHAVPDGTGHSVNGKSSSMDNAAADVSQQPKNVSKSKKKSRKCKGGGSGNVSRTPSSATLGEHGIKNAEKSGDKKGRTDTGSSKTMAKGRGQSQG